MSEDRHNSPQPHGAHEMPAPSIWPVTLALGATLLTWGLITSGVLIGVGLALFALALGGWIGELRHERRK